MYITVFLRVNVFTPVSLKHKVTCTKRVAEKNFKLIQSQTSFHFLIKLYFYLCYANCTYIPSVRCRSMSASKETRDQTTEPLNGYPSINTMCWWGRKIAHLCACIVVPNRIKYRGNSSYQKSHKDARAERNRTKLT